MPRQRPVGVTSRMMRAPGERHPWATRGVTIDLPVIVDWVNVDPDTGAELVRIEATIDLVDGPDSSGMVRRSRKLGIRNLSSEPCVRMRSRTVGTYRR